MSARPFFPHEADDPDLDWLVSNFLHERPHFIPVEAGALPIVLIPYHGTYDVSRERVPKSVFIKPAEPLEEQPADEE
jgi:hypothetical protein